MSVEESAATTGCACLYGRAAKEGDGPILGNFFYCLQGSCGATNNLQFNLQLYFYLLDVCNSHSATKVKRRMYVS